MKATTVQIDGIRLVASLQQSSEHPLAHAVIEKAKADGLTLSPPSKFEAIPGQGAHATVDGRTVLTGNRKLMDDNRMALDGLNERAKALEHKGNTVVYTAVDGSPAGLIAIADAIRPNAKQAIDQLAALGIEVAMLTGGNQGTANLVAKELGIKTVFAEVQPGQKLDVWLDLDRGRQRAVVETREDERVRGSVIRSDAASGVRKEEVA